MIAYLHNVLKKNNLSQTRSGGEEARYFLKCSSCGYHVIANETHELKGAYLFPGSKLEKGGERALRQMADCISFFLRPWNRALAALIERRTRQKNRTTIVLWATAF